MQEMRVISEAELVATGADVVPERDTLAFVNIANVVTLNVAIAINAATIGSSANAWAGQLVAVGQY